MDPRSLGEKIRRLREARGWSLRQLEARSGVSNSAISLIERGKRVPSSETLRRLALALGVTIRDLYEDDRGTFNPAALLARGLPLRLRRARLLAGLSLKQAAQRANVPQQDLQAWESGTRRPDPDVLVRLAKLYGVPVSYLLAEEPEVQRPTATTVPELPPGVEGVPVRLVPVPVVGRVHAGESMPPTEHLEGFEWMAEDDVRGGTYFYLIVRGDCMDAGPAPIREGYRVLVRVQPDVEDGQVAVVFLPGEDEAVLRRVRKAGEHVVLTADNPSYPPVVLRPEEVRIVGRVVQVTFEPAAAREV